MNNFDCILELIAKHIGIPKDSAKAAMQVAIDRSWQNVSPALHAI